MRLQYRVLRDNLGFEKVSSQIFYLFKLFDDGLITGSILDQFELFEMSELTLIIVMKMDSVKTVYDVTFRISNNSVRLELTATTDVFA
jgi:hypothetical protein